MNEEIYALNITSIDGDKNTSFYGSYMTSSDSGALVTIIKEVTPFEMFASAEIFGCMINSSSPIRVQITKRSAPNNPIVEGEGMTHLVHVEVNGNKFIYSK